MVEFDAQDKAVSLEEKPAKPKSSFAVPGLYAYSADVVQYARDLKPGTRGELEITDLNRIYLEQNRLSVSVLGRGIAWLDTGTNQSLLEASHFVQAVEERQGLKIACLEEIAWNQGWITQEMVEQAQEHMGKSMYGNYLRDLLKTKR